MKSYYKWQKIKVGLDNLDVIVTYFAGVEERDITSVQLYGQEIGGWLNNETYGRIWGCIDSRDTTDE